MNDTVVVVWRVVAPRATNEGAMTYECLTWNQATEIKACLLRKGIEATIEAEEVADEADDFLETRAADKNPQ